MSAALKCLVMTYKLMCTVPLLIELMRQRSSNACETGGMVVRRWGLEWRAGVGARHQRVRKSAAGALDGQSDAGGADLREEDFVRLKPRLAANEERQQLLAVGAEGPPSAARHRVHARCRRQAALPVGLEGAAAMRVQPPDMQQ